MIINYFQPTISRSANDRKYMISYYQTVITMSLSHSIFKTLSVHK